jgi:predicted aspartyl protease
MKMSFDPRKPIVVRVFLAGPTGVRTARLILDTGAATTMINTERLGLVGIEPRADSFRMTATATDVERMPLVTVKTLALGEHQKFDLPVLAHDLPGVAGVDGLLGMDFLTGLHLSLRMRRGLLTLEEDRDAS